MSDILNPDLCVIGAGSGGLSVAAAAAAMGVSVVLVEKGAMGGDCLNTGCVPSKALLAAAANAQAHRTAGSFGVHESEPRVDFARVQAHVQEVIKAIAPMDSQARFEAMGVRVIRAAARFVSRTELEAGGLRVRARRFVLATGSSPRLPKLPGLETIRPLTNESIFDLTALPASLIVLGAGPVGLELAQAFRRLGSEVTVLEAERALAQEDPELAAPVLARLAQEGIVLREGIGLSHVEPRHGGVRLYLSGHALEETVDGSHLLIAIGREPNLDGLGLELAGVALDGRRLRLNRRLRTTNRRIYAVGDVAGGRFTHEAGDQSGLVLRSVLFRLRAKVHPQLVPRVIYTDPEIAVTGLDEAGARAAHRHIEVHRWPFSENDRARAERTTAGHVKVITDRHGRVLGAGIVGPHAGELIALWQLAVTKELKIGDIAGLVLPYPTLSEASRRAAITRYERSLRSPWLSRVLRLMRLFG